MLQYFELIFPISGEGEVLRIPNEDKIAVLCSFSGGMLNCSILYDYSDTPLQLSGKAAINDRVLLRFRPYRIELYINDRLMDEEWCCGSHYLNNPTLFDEKCTFILRSTPHPYPLSVPSVLGTFQNAEGWQPEENVFVGDCMPYCHEGVYHVLYLKDRHHHRSKWGKGAHQWSHISTADFVNWSIHPMAIEIDQPWEGSICTGSWIFDGQKHYLYYTVRMCDASAAPICRTVSKDGFHFKKDHAFHFTLSSKYNVRSARDPKLFKDENGLYHMLLTTSLISLGRGCIAHLVSDDLNTWHELDEPIFIAPEGMGEPECPDYFYKDGFYYLVYSLRGKGYYLYSRKPFSDWQTPDEPIIPCKSVPKAAIWQDRLIFAGFDGGGKYAGTMTFLEAVVQENGQFAYQKPS